MLINIYVHHLGTEKKTHQKTPQKQKKPPKPTFSFISLSFLHRVSSFHLNNSGTSITEKVIIPSILPLLRHPNKDY